MNSRRPFAALALVLAAFPAGCADPLDPAESPAGAVEQSLETPTCITIQRGSGGVVADAKLRADQPTANFGAIDTFVTGNQFSSRASLLRFDLGAIPPGQDIVSASVTLHEISNLGDSTIDAHAVTAPWSEATVTWSNFGGAYAAASGASFSNGGAGHTGAVTFDATALTRSAHAGANDGMALTAASNSTWASSEHADPTLRPSMDVCYRPSITPVLGSAFVKANDGGGWLTYATSSCGIFHLYLLGGTDPVQSPILNAPDGTMSIPLADGVTTYGVLGTDGNTSGATQFLQLDIGGVQFTVDETPGSSQTAIVGSKIVTVSAFSFTIPTDAGYSSLDRVAVCG
jgi:hypothetical protein